MNSTLIQIDQLHDRKMDAIDSLLKEFALDDSRAWMKKSEEDISTSDKKTIAKKYSPNFEKIDPRSVQLLPNDLQETIQRIAKWIVEFLLGPFPSSEAVESNQQKTENRIHEDLLQKLQLIISEPKPKSVSFRP